MFSHRTATVRASLCGLLVITVAGCTSAQFGQQAAGAPAAGAVSAEPAGNPGSPASATPGSPASATPGSPASATLLPPVPVAVSPTGDWVASGLDGLTLVDRTGAPSHPIPAAKQVRYLSWSPAGDWLLAAGLDGRVLVVHPADGRVVDLAGKLPGLQDAWLLTTWSPDSRRVLISADFVGVRPEGIPIWEVTAAAGLVRKVADSSRVVGLHWLGGDKALVLQAAGCCGAQAALLNLTTGKPSDLGHHGSYAVSPDGQLLAIAPYMSGAVVSRDLVSGAEIRPPVSAAAGWYRLWVNSYSPDSRLLAFTFDQDNRQTLYVADRTGAEPLVISDWAGTLVWLDNGHEFLYDTHVGDGFAVHINERTIATHKGAKYLGLMSAGPVAVRSPDGRRVAYAVEMAAHESLLAVVDVTTGEVRTLPDSTGLTPLTWTADGAGLIVAERAFTRTDLGGGLATEGWALHQIKMMPVTRGKLTSNPH